MAGVAKVAVQTLEGVLTYGRGTAKQLPGLLTINQPVAGKTGSTDNLESLWFCGITPQVSVAVWTGHKDGDYTVRLGYGAGAHPFQTSNKAFAYFVNAVLSDTPRADWPMASASDPSYKPNTSWKFSNTSAGENDPDAATTEAATTEAATTENATTPTEPTPAPEPTPTPTPAPEPTPSPEPTPDPDTPTEGQ